MTDDIPAVRARWLAQKGAGPRRLTGQEFDLVVDTVVTGLTEVERLRAERKQLRSALVRAHDAMGSVTVFVTSRERIKQPEGEAWWDEECDAVESALDSTTPSPGVGT